MNASRSVPVLSVNDAVSVDESLDKGQVEEDSTELDPWEPPDQVDRYPMWNL